MAYVVETLNDIRAELGRSGNLPSTASDGSKKTLFACHDTEGGVGRSGAIGTARYLIDVTATRNASYHEIVWFEESVGRCGVLILVPANRASHSIAPQPISPTSGKPLYAPDDWVRESLGSIWWNPNQGVYAISIAGYKADVARYSRNPIFVAFMNQRFSDLSKALGIKRRAEHFRFNPYTRTDWGLELTPVLGGLTIGGEQTDMNFAKDVEAFAYGTIRENVYVYESPYFGSPRNPTGDVARRVRLLARSCEGSEYGPEGGKSNRWVPFVNNDVVKYVPAVYVTIEENTNYDALKDRISRKDAAFGNIINEAAKGKDI